jgi:hypothetical protein
MPFRPLKAKLREIKRNSRRVERDGFDRAQEIAFVLAAIIAPVAVMKLDTSYTRSTNEVIAAGYAFQNPDSNKLFAIEVPVEAKLRPPIGTLPLAELRLVETHTWHGWPLSTRLVTSAARVEPTLLATCPEELRAEILSAGSALFTSKSKLPSPGTTTTYFGGWIFSIGAWWVLLTVAAALVLMPARAAWRVRKAVRNAVRQGRIDRCHCPNCGYDARGSILLGRCPECGHELYERPDW